MCCWRGGFAGFRADSWRYDHVTQRQKACPPPLLSTVVVPTAFRLHPVSLRASVGVLWVLNCVWLCVVAVTGAGGAHHPYSSILFAVHLVLLLCILHDAQFRGWRCPYIVPYDDFEPWGVSGARLVRLIAAFIRVCCGTVGWICRISGRFQALRSRNAEAEGVPAATAEHCGRANRLSAASSEPAGVCGSALGPELCLVVCGGGDWCWWCSPPLL